MGARRKELSRPPGLVLNPAMLQTQPPARYSVHRNMIQLAVVLVLGGWTSGCVPMRYTSGPGAKGKVVDASSRAPIDHAFVTVTRSKGAAAQTSTSKKGEFHVGARNRWYLLNLFSPSKPVPESAVITVEGPGYQSYTTNTPLGTKMLELGEIQLKTLSP